MQSSVNKPSGAITRMRGSTGAKQTSLLNTAPPYFITTSRYAGGNAPSLRSNSPTSSRESGAYSPKSGSIPHRASFSSNIIRSPRAGAGRTRLLMRKLDETNRTIRQQQVAAALSERAATNRQKHATASLDQGLEHRFRLIMLWIIWPQEHGASHRHVSASGCRAESSLRCFDARDRLHNEGATILSHSPRWR